MQNKNPPHAPHSSLLHRWPVIGLGVLVACLPGTGLAAWFDCRPTPDGHAWACRSGKMPHINAEPPVHTTAPHPTARLCPRPASFTPPAIPRPGEIRLRARRSEGDNRRMTLSGNVVIEQRGQRLRAARVIFDKPRNRITATGNVRIEGPGIRINGSHASKQIHGLEAAIHNAAYQLAANGARGKARSLRRLANGVIVLRKASYTTCPAGRGDWLLKADRVKLDRRDGTGTAHNVVLRFKGMPILYVPRFSFPIDKRRKSGFLSPSFGTSSSRGLDISIPWYWNIAPNRDATIIPRYMSKRGMQLGAEYRYLKKYGKGRVAAEYLPGDDVAGRDRSLFSYRHQGRIGRFTTDIDYARASDPDYFTDLRTGLNITGSTYLTQRADLKWSRRGWTVLTRVQRFQPLAGSSENYRQQPLLDISGSLPTGRRWLQIGMHAQYVAFDHNDNVVTGRRIDLRPSVGIDIRRPGWFVNPRLSLRHTRYDLDNPGAGNPDRPTRNLPIFSFDSGVYLERTTTLFSRRFVQTLEPRLYYLYVPYRDQSQLPVFDSSSYSFSFQQMFRDNRFSGADRQADANQLTLALTSRYIDPASGREWLRLGIGQIVYFEDRRVTLPGESVETAGQSDLVAEFSLAPSRGLKLSGYGQWDTASGLTRKSSLLLRYSAPGGSLFQAGYRFQRGDLEQTDLAWLWHLSARWRTVMRWNYSLLDRQTLERLAGIEYNSCCWGVRLVAQQYINSSTGAQDKAIYLQLVLKGLGKLGQDIDSLLRSRILGYTERQ